MKGLALALVSAVVVILLVVLGVSTLSSNSDIWSPEPGTSWQWQLTGDEIDLSYDVDAYDIEGFGNTERTVEEIHRRDAKAICYISVGSWEDWRPDADRFPESVIGQKYEGWDGEWWLDIRKIDELAPIMRDRLDMCADKGFDAVEPDNIDGYTNETGFPLTYDDQLRYNTWLAREAHERGLSIGLKNDGEQAEDLEPYYDWAMTEDCFDGEWCQEMSPFVENGNAVLAAEYTDTGITRDDFCGRAWDLRFDAILKRRELGAWRRGC